MFDLIIDKMKNSNNEFDLTIGTDSQNHSRTKVVNVIALHEVGAGGIFFYQVHYLNRIHDLRTKIYQETKESLQVANDLADALFENDLMPNIVIHADIGKRGKTKETIAEIVGWVTAEGFECRIKPDSYAASTIADKISK